MRPRAHLGVTIGARRIGLESGYGQAPAQAPSGGAAYLSIMPSGPSLEERQAQVAVALGRRPADLVIRRARLVNVYTGEVLEGHDVATSGRWIAYVGPDAGFAIGERTRVVDAAGRWLTPGLIDGHTHVATRCAPEEFVRYVAPGGTTTVVTELIELASILGAEGIRVMLDALADQPIAFFGTLPPLAALAPFMEDVAPSLQEYRALLARDDVVGLGEVYWGNLLRGDARLLALVVEAQRAGKVVEGHAAGARGQRLAAYAAAGVTSCHEPITAEEGLERLRLGFHWMARDGETRQDLEAFAPLWRDGTIDLRRLVLVTDSVGPRRLLRAGYLDETLRRAIGLGLAPVAAIRAVTLNVAEHFRLDHLTGGIAPGRWADLVLVEDLRAFRPWQVYSRGRLIAQDGRLVVSPRPVAFPATVMASVRWPAALDPDVFTVPAPGGDQARVRVIEMVTHLVTREGEAVLPVRDGAVQMVPAAGVVKAAALDRSGRAAERFVGFVRGFGVERGAVATTMAWDAQCLVVVGADERDMAAAARRLLEMQGGAAVAVDGTVVAEFAAPIAGVLSAAPLPEIAAALERIDRALRDLGSRLDDPLLAADVLTTAAIPHLRLTPRGYVRLRDGQLVGLFPTRPAGTG
ncbi:MAG: adenine deaminase C-terminal domain-containing protein [Armatimonadota bacterium]|nr:adenine deaminase C-terminal domain-containing protein [Armatimonadota bacterium]MDR7486983.1 adenine deaminase C-terminal domain-containing protein [Armatimonadota bacterium]MDR7536159.1 adenine deaminase C-terminal domain-containing protein [Armatimonadota bacterium]